MISEGGPDGKVIKMRANFSAFENKPCPKWLKEHGLFGLQERRPRKDKTNDLKIFASFSCRPKISGQGNKF